MAAVAGPKPPCVLQENTWAVSYSTALEIFTEQTVWELRTPRSALFSSSHLLRARGRAPQSTTSQTGPHKLRSVVSSSTLPATSMAQQPPAENSVLERYSS